MCGRIICKYPVRKKHHFSRDKDGRCTWYFVKMVNSLVEIMPETCISDLDEVIKKHKYNLDTDEESDPRQIEAWLKLQEWQKDRLLFRYG
jgi:hypothetical protein